MSTIAHAQLDGKMKFVATTGSGHAIVMDAMENVGGSNKGPRPAELPFAGLAGCTGMDTISILRKMRQDVTHFSVEIKGLDKAEEHPKVWKKIEVLFHVQGEVDPKKLEKAINLSKTRYCTVSTSLKDPMIINYSYDLNGEKTEIKEE